MPGGAQEREEAARVFGAGAEAPAATFEPDEELAQAEEAAAVAVPAPTKGPTAEQLTAIKVGSCHDGIAKLLVAAGMSASPASPRR